jgi:hypothetical protein
MFSKFEILRDLAILRLVLDTSRVKNRALLAHLKPGSIECQAALRTGRALIDCSMEHERLSALNEGASQSPEMNSALLALHAESGALFVEIEFLFDELKAKRLPLPTPLHRYLRAA